MALAPESTTKTVPRRLGFAGLGAMGMGMAKNLIQAGFHVSGFDVFPKTLEAFTTIGGRASVSLQDAGRDQSKFFIMVASPQQVDQLVDDLSIALPQSAIICLFSTLPPAYIVNLKSRLETIGRPDIRLLDCPVSGGAVGANAGRLTIMMGGDKETINEIQSELDAVSAPGRLFHTGGLGSASTIKMLNQHLAGSHVVAAAETLAFAKALGLSSREAYGILTKSEGASWIMGDRGISMLAAEYSPKSAVTIFTKDMGIVNAAADGSLLSCPIASEAYQAFAERNSRGHGRDDDASVVCNYEDITGVKVTEPKVDTSVPTPSPSPPLEPYSVVFVLNDEQGANKLHQLSAEPGTSGKKQTNIIVCKNSDDFQTTLNDIPLDAFVGITGTYDQQASVRNKFAGRPEHRFFDFQLVNSDDYKSLQVLYTAEDTHIEAALNLASKDEISVVPVHGQFGSASSMYVVVRLASLIHLAAAAECYALAIAEGVSVQLLYSLISGAAGSSAQFNQVFPKMIAQDFAYDSSAGTRSLSQAMEDLNLVKSLTQKIGFPARMFDAAHQMFKNAGGVAGDLQSSTAALTLLWKHQRVMSRI